MTGYNVYRSDAAFESPASATKINPAPVTGTSYDDLLLQDGVWTYRVVSLNSQSVASLPSNAVEAISDGTAPRAVSIAYTPQGRSDPVTGRVGQGRVDLVLTVSEALRMTPYLAIVPAGGAPLTVELTARSETTYSGSFLVGAATPAGVATALFSARDIVGNQGSDIDAGASLLLDTAGPILSHIAVTPAAPIDNDDTPALQVTFRFDKAPAAAPQISYRLSGAARSPQALALTPLDATTYRAEFTLPTDAGLSGPETLSFAFQAQDDLDNISTRVAAANAFQVYRGELPPADIPAGLTATAQAGGKVRLAWQAVDQASAYQIYRQGPDQSALEIHLRASGAEYIDATPADGLYRYAVASVRQANDQETLSGQSAAVEVTARATAPGAPQNLTLTLTGQGILASWQAPFASEVDHYKLYRGPGTQLDSIEGLIPLKTHIKSLQAYDTDPSPSEGAYVVTAVDAAGNESALSNSPYLNASLLPVRKLRLEQIGTALPQLSWSPPNGSLAGYLVYVGPENARIKLTASPINATQFTDTGYTSGERHYSVATVDANDAELGHDIILPSIATQIAAGLPLKRGIMNKLQIQLANTSTRPLDGVRALVRLPVDRDSSQFEEHHSEALSLAPGETRLVPVIVGGYAELPARASALIGVDIEPAEGDHIRVAREQTLEVGEGALVVGMATEDFTRGGVGKLRLTIENTTDVDIELLTATAHGSQPSTELRFKLLDADGNVLATQAYQQVFGANVVTLTNGLTVARITAGASYLSDPFELNVPAASPNTLRVRLEVDTLRYNSGKDDEIRIAGRGSETTVSLLDTFYTGEVTDVTPISSFGDSDIVISGHAIERATHAPLANARLNLILNQQGFERRYSVLTDAAGQFVYTFTPTLTDAGLYKVSAVHPEITDRPEQRVFTINRVTAGPSPYKLDIPKNYPFDIPFKANAGAGTTATHLRLELNPASQPTGELPAGLTVELPAPVNLAERQTLNIPVRFTANNDAQPSGSLILDVVSDEHPTPLGRVRIDYRLSEASPHLVSTPSYIETGLAQGGSQIESLTVKNNGLQDAIGLVFTLTQANGNPAPAWASIASQANGTLSIGQTRAIDLAFTPPAGTTEGIYEFRLNVAGQNIPAQALNVYVSLTQSGKGGILFKASDIYTATIGKDGRLIAGLAGATVTLQNEDVPSISAELKTDSQGEALFEGLPAGRYQFRVRAPDHQEVGGRLTIKPGITATQPVFLDYNLITVEWSVREITLEDRYEITLNATYETDVPAAVVMMQPVSVNLPKMAAGDVYYGELTLTNYGLVRADDLIQEFPSSDSYFRYEFLVDMPETLEAKQRITIPYRVIALQSLDAADGDASGGGCYSYTNTTCACYNYECANGDKSSGRSCTTWLHVDNSTCPGGSGGWSGGGGGGIGDGGGFGGAGTSYQPMPGLPPCINKCDGACCIPSTVGGGGWGPRY
ncbi:MAG: carboxypeptidase-like regulatory domain-containing protein [Candidatus Accumulibacter sp.]|nr:carboxypeptidase-like regulatory domain-containing protein [Accumulibacter sp.]